MVIFCGCENSFDIIEPSPKSTPLPTTEKNNYAKKYPDAIEAVKFNKDFLATPKDFIGKKVQIIGTLSPYDVKEMEDKDGKMEKRLEFHRKYPKLDVEWQGS